MTLRLSRGSGPYVIGLIQNSRGKRLELSHVHCNVSLTLLLLLCLAQPGASLGL